MSGYSQCSVGLTARAVREYLMAMMNMTNSEGNTFSDVLADMTRENYEAFGSSLFDPSVDPTVTHEDNPLNGGMDFSYYIKDGEIINVEAVIPGNVVEEFFKDKLRGRSDTWGMRGSRSLIIVTVADKNPDGTSVMENYVDIESGGEQKQRPRTSIRAISYNPHTNGSQDTAEGTVIQDEVVRGACIELGNNMATKNRGNAQKFLDAIKDKSYEPAAKKLGGKCTIKAKSSKLGGDAEKGLVNIVTGAVRLDLDEGAVEDVARKMRGGGKDKVY